MDLGVISVRYARALLKGAVEQKVEAQVCKEMQSLYSCYLEVPALKTAVSNPMLPKNKKKELLLTACGPEQSEITGKFIQLVLNGGRGEALQFMAASFITLYRKLKNITRGKLSTAVAVSAEVEQKMRRMVESRTLGTVEFNTEVNPDLLGGFVLEYDTYRLDASVRTRLATILSQIK